MSIIQRISNELFVPERKLTAAVQLGLTGMLSVMAFASSYFKKTTNVSPQYALIGGITTFVVSNLTDSIIKASFDKKPDGSRSIAFRIIKAGILGGMDAISLHLTGVTLQSYNIPLGDRGFETAFSTNMVVYNIVPCRFMDF